MDEIKNMRERAIVALNEAHECEAGGDAIHVIQRALEDARAEAFEEAIKLVRKALRGPKDWGGMPLALHEMEHRRWRDPTKCDPIIV